MSLLQNEDFLIYQLRTAYLTHIKDGVGERLINVNTSVLNDPAFRDAGWTPSSEVKRCYSPPIPTAITADYFKVPRSANLNGVDFIEDEEEGGMVTGGHSTDTVGPSLQTRRRRRKEREEEEDSSDLSDESDDELEGASRAAQRIKFNKMPLRSRAESSPLQSSRMRDSAELQAVSPSKPSDGNAFRRGSSGAVEAVKKRARADTTTSSEMSSDNELDPSLFRRRTVKFSRAAKSELIVEPRNYAEKDSAQSPNSSKDDEDSDLSSELEDTMDSASLLDEVANHLTSSPLRDAPRLPPLTFESPSPKKHKPRDQPIQNIDLPPMRPRPISVVKPKSALTMAIKNKDKTGESPFQGYASLSGKGDPNPLWIKIYAPHASEPEDPLEVPVRRFTTDGNSTTVADMVGLSLWRYSEEARDPPISEGKKNVNKWMLRMVEDGEVDYDFPALAQTKPISDFTSNNNRGVRGRSREKPWDEFALVEATEEQFRENERITPSLKEDPLLIGPTSDYRADTPGPVLRQNPDFNPAPDFTPVRNPIIDSSFASAALRKDNSNYQDAPLIPKSTSASRTGENRTLNIYFTDNNLRRQTIPCTVTTDTYLGEIFEQVCKKLKVDRGLYVLKVTNTNTVAPTDRTVEALGTHTNLDLTRRRFVGDASFGLSGSPRSSSPNAPLFLTSSGTPTKKAGKKTVAAAAAAGMHPLAQQTDNLSFINQAASASSNYKRWNVLRKQPMSFASTHPRVLALDGEYMHIMPGEINRTADGDQQVLHHYQAAPGKTTTVHFSSIVFCKVSRKHPKTFRVHVFREKETKRYDFEAHDAAEAAEIVLEIKKGIDEVT